MKYLSFGADVVVGHHPHIVENYEKIGDKIIFYSLGNFIFDTDYQRLQKYTEYGILLKLDFGKDSFTWDHMAIEIDRDTQTINKTETPDIFTDVPASQYKLLWPLAINNLYKNEKVKFAYLFPKFKEYTAYQWFCRDVKNYKTPAGKDLIHGRILYHFGLWRFADKKLVNYIKNGHKKQER